MKMENEKAQSKPITVLTTILNELNTPTKWDRFNIECSSFVERVFIMKKAFENLEIENPTKDKVSELFGVSKEALIQKDDGKEEFDITEGWTPQGLEARLVEIAKVLKVPINLSEEEKDRLENREYLILTKAIIVNVVGISGFNNSSVESRVIDILNNLALYSVDALLHSIRVALYMRAIVNNVKEFESLKGPSTERIMRAALLHDIGKLITPQVFYKRKLEDIEYEEIKKHAEYSLKMIEMIGDLSYEYELVETHHQNWSNTNGYPFQKKSLSEVVEGNKALEVFLFAFLDKYDAISSHRGYSGKFRDKKKTFEILSCSGCRNEEELNKDLLRVIQEQSEVLEVFDRDF